VHWWAQAWENWWAQALLVAAALVWVQELLALPDLHISGWK
jgi:hypothetical protein